MRSALLLLAAAGLLNAPEPPKNDEKQPANEMVGRWEGRNAETFDGKGGLKSVWVVQQDKITTTLNRNGQDRTSEWKYCLNSEKTPKEIDLIPGAGPGAGKTLKGIFKIESDTLTICYVLGKTEGAEKRDRPVDFDVKKRNDLVMLTFERK